MFTVHYLLVYHCDYDYCSYYILIKLPCYIKLQTSQNLAWLCKIPMIRHLHHGLPLPPFKSTHPQCRAQWRTRYSCRGWLKFSMHVFANDILWYFDPQVIIGTNSDTRIAFRISKTDRFEVHCPTAWVNPQNLTLLVFKAIFQDDDQAISATR